MTSLHVIGGLGRPPIKNSGYAYDGCYTTKKTKIKQLNFRYSQSKNKRYLQYAQNYYSRCLKLSQSTNNYKAENIAKYKVSQTTKI